MLKQNFDSYAYQNETADGLDFVSKELSNCVAQEEARQRERICYDSDQYYRRSYVSLQKCETQANNKGIDTRGN
jgi:hypothetical protein